EYRVTDIVPGATVELIRPATDTRVDHRTRSPAVLCAVVVRLQTKLRDSIWRRRNIFVRESLVGCAIGIIVQAIQQEIIKSAALSVNVERRLAARRRLILQKRLTHARGQQCKIGIGPAIERQVLDLLCPDNLPTGSRLRL